MNQATLFETAEPKAHDPLAHVPQDCRSTYLAFVRTYGDELVPSGIRDAWLRCMPEYAADLAAMIEIGLCFESEEGIRFV